MLERVLMKHIFFVIALALIFVNVAAAKTYCVDDDGSDCPTADFVKIQDAVDAASSGDEILVYPGVYFEDVVLNKRLTLRGVDSPEINGEREGIRIRAAGCWVEGFRINFCELAGLSVESEDNVIIRNIIEHNKYGIKLQRASKNIIRENKLMNNDYGLYLHESSENFIYLNDIIGNVDSVYSYKSQNWWHSQGRVSYVYNGKTFENYLANYWSDHKHVDLDGDGICDYVYLIDGEDEDYFPLIMPFENYEILRTPEVMPSPAAGTQDATTTGAGDGSGGAPAPTPTRTPTADGALLIFGFVSTLLMLKEKQRRRATEETRSLFD